MKRPVFFAALCCLMACPLAFAAMPFDANTSGQLYYALQNPSDPYHLAYMGYVGGAADALQAVSYVCRPPRTSYGAEDQLVENYLAANPAKWNQPASVSIGTALIKAFPCPSKRQ
uniref:Rap1a immunity protein domain-containing protein n=1 Tax=mine drainage metagenome TaxID=410659 RepID=E6PLG2_9ZZZZ